ncbi:MGMT family protein [Modestobacter sp. VKM Ac-2979]|uniref:MGMT family protein n=1 Tax=unclassified Modestobacter TaxID=2643866 RepID=UPI0022AB5BC5|nr:MULTISPECIES: MGMT family protein [unclassified Modestobacter]MCZ2814448.1 MGMT family protein [Modestobacter sp. VKM Ac-2979]MCZ2844774.1 MGMT family protein [Modestobacter sp. VKM Ac-2980]
MSDVAARVLSTVSSIPSGHVMTCGDLAEAAGTGARAVGQVLRNGGHDVPWWRVVDATGRLAHPRSGHDLTPRRLTSGAVDLTEDPAVARYLRSRVRGFDASRGAS